MANNSKYNPLRLSGQVALSKINFKNSVSSRVEAGLVSAVDRKILRATQGRPLRAQKNFSIYSQKHIVILILFSIILFSLMSCSNDSSKKEKTLNVKTEPNIQTLKDMPYHADTLLPPTIETYDINRLDESVTIKAINSKTNLGGSAGHYLDYNFIGLTSAKYNVKGIPVSVEVAEFATSEDAYGHYSILRPNGITLIKMGTESYTLGASRYIAQGPYVITLSTDDTTGNAVTAVSLLGHEIVGRIAEKPLPPNWYILFPYKNKVAASKRYYAYNYLDIPDFNQAYTTDFIVNKDTVTIFLTHDPNGEQFIKFMDYANTVTKLEVPELIDFDKGYSVSFMHPKYGVVIGGMAREKVVGILNYNPEKHYSFLSTWVADLQR